MLKKESFFQYLLIQSVNYSNDKFVNFIPEHNTPIGLAKLSQLNSLKAKKDLNSESILLKTKYPTLLKAGGEATSSIPLKQELFASTKISRGICPLKKQLKLKTINSSTVFLLFRKNTPSSKAVMLEAKSTKNTKFVKSMLETQINSIKSKSLIKKYTKTNSTFFKNPSNKKIQKLKEIFLGGFAPANKENFIKKVSLSKTKKFDTVSFSKNDSLKIPDNIFLVNKSYRKIYCMSFSEKNNFESQQTIKNRGLRPREQNIFPKQLTSSFLLDSMKIYRPYPYEKTNNKNKTNFIFNVFLTYKKSFLCYWLLPLIGLISLTNINISSNFQTPNFVFLRQNEKDIIKQPQTMAEKNGLNKSEILEVLQPSILLAKDSIPIFYSLKSNILDNQHLLKKSFDLFKKNNAQNRLLNSYPSLLQVRLPMNHVAYSATFFKAGLPLIRPEYSLSVYSVPNFTEQLITSLPAKANIEHPFDLTVSTRGTNYIEQKNFLKCLKKIYYNNFCKQETNIAINDELKKSLNSSFEIDFAKLNFSILKEKLKKQTRFNFYWYELTVTSNNEENQYFPNKILAPMQSLIQKMRGRSPLKTTLLKAYNIEAPSRTALLYQKLSKESSNTTMFKKTASYKKFFMSQEKKKISRNTKNLREVFFAGGKENYQSMLAQQNLVADRFSSSNPYKQLLSQAMPKLAEETTTKNLIGITSKQNKSTKNILNAKSNFVKANIIPYFEQQTKEHQKKENYRNNKIFFYDQKWKKQKVVKYLGGFAPENTKNLLNFKTIDYLNKAQLTKHAKLSHTYFAKQITNPALQGLEEKIITPAKSLKKASYLLDYLLVNNIEIYKNAFFKNLFNLDIFKNDSDFSSEKSLLSKNAKKLTETIVLLIAGASPPKNHISEDKYIRSQHLDRLSTSKSESTIASKIKTLNDRETLYDFIFQGLKMDFDKIITNLGGEAPAIFSKTDKCYFNDASPAETIISPYKANSFLKLTSPIVGGNLKTKFKKTAPYKKFVKNISKKSQHLHTSFKEKQIISNTLDSNNLKKMDFTINYIPILSRKLMTVKADINLSKISNETNIKKAETKFKMKKESIKKGLRPLNTLTLFSKYLKLMTNKIKHELNPYPVGVNKTSVHEQKKKLASKNEFYKNQIGKPYLSMMNLGILNQKENTINTITDKNSSEHNFAVPLVMTSPVNRVLKTYHKSAKKNIFVKNSKTEKIFLSYLSLSKTGSHLNLTGLQKQYSKKAQIESIFSILKKPMQNKLLNREQKIVNPRFAVKTYGVKNYKTYNKNFAKLPKKSLILLLKNRLFINKKQNNEFWGDLKINAKSLRTPTKNTISEAINQSDLQQKIIQETRRKKQQLKLKRRLKKMQCATRRRKKRKIFYPRPNWITFTLYDKFLKSRFLQIKNETSRISQTPYNLTSPQSLYKKVNSTDILGAVNLTSKNSLNLTKINFYKANFLTKNYRNRKSISYYNTTPLAKDFYSISTTVFRDLRRILMKSNWLRNYLNQYFEKIKTIYKEIERDSKKLDLFFRIRSLILSFYGSSLYSTSVSHDVKASCDDMLLHNSNKENQIQRNSQSASINDHSINNSSVLIFEYNRLIYQRIQRLILNIRENLNLNGQLKNRSQKLGKNIRPFIKRDYMKRDNNIAVNQTENIFVKNFKKNIFNLSRHFVLLNKGYEESIPYISENLTPLVQNNLYWTWNKTENLFDLNNSNNSSYSKKLWEKYKIREINKNNKTKKMIFNLFMKYNNLLNDKNILNADTAELYNWWQNNLQYTQNFEDKKNKITQNWTSQNFFCEENENSFGTEKSEKQRNSISIKPLLQNDNTDKLINSSITTKTAINFYEQSQESNSNLTGAKPPKSLAIKNYIDKSEKKLINIEYKLNLLGLNSNRSIQQSFLLKKQNKQYPIYGNKVSKKRLSTKKFYRLLSEQQQLKKQLIFLLKKRMYNSKVKIVSNTVSKAIVEPKHQQILRISPLSFKKIYFRFLKQELLKEKNLFSREILRHKSNNTENKSPSSVFSIAKNRGGATNQSSIENLQKRYYTTKQKTFQNMAGIKILGQIQNYNKFSNTTYWWTKLKTENFSFKKIGGFAPATQKKLKLNKIFESKIFSDSRLNNKINIKTTYYLTLISFLFHFCTFLSFISFGGIRTVLKFYYILFSKISKLINQIRFAKLLPESPQKSSFKYSTKELLLAQQSAAFKKGSFSSSNKKSPFFIEKSDKQYRKLKNLDQQSNFRVSYTERSNTRFTLMEKNNTPKASFLKVLFLFKSLKVLFLKYLVSKSQSQSLTKTSLLLGYFDKNIEANNKYIDSFADNLSPDVKKNSEAVFDESKQLLLKQFTMQPRFKDSIEVTNSKEKITNFFFIKNASFNLFLVRGVNFFLNSYIKSLNRSIDKSNRSKLKKKKTIKIEQGIQLARGFAPNRIALLYKQLFYNVNKKTSIGLNLVHKVSFYSYLLLLKSVDILVAPAFWIYKFFEKPGEYVVENLAYSFLLEWSADLVATIPDSIDTTFSIYFNKVNRNMPLYLFINPKLIINPSQMIGTIATRSISNLLESIFNLFLFGINSSILKRFTNSSLLLFIQQLSEPDFDYINRRKKGIIFWDLWGEGLKTIAEKNSVNIYELSTDKEEQLKLLSNMENNIGYGNKSDTLKSNKFNLNYASFFGDIKNSEAVFLNLDKNKRKMKLTKLSTMQKFFINVRLQKNSEAVFYEQQIETKTNKKQLLKKSFFRGRSPRDKKQLRCFFEPLLLDRWSVNQFLNYHGKDTDLFIDLHPPRTFSTAATSLKYSFSIQAPIGSIVCQIFGGIFYKQISKNILVVLPKSSQNNKGHEKSLLIQAIAGETELKIITDNAYRYAMVIQGVAVGIKLLKDVFEALCATGPCIFLIEDIHAIGERRPFLIDEASPNLTESIYNKNQSMQSFLLKEKSQTSRETLYRTNKHLLTNYKKPYKEVKRLASNHFSFTFLYRATNFTKIRTGEIHPSEIPLSIQISQKEIGRFGESKNIDKNIQDTNNHSNFAKLLDEKDLKIQTDSTILKTENKENVYSSFSLLIKSIKNKQSLINTPSSSPFSLLLMKEATKLKPNQSVKEMSWFGLPGESYSLISKYNYSIRVKVALLADLILSNMSNKLEMITDLLVIIDSVKGNRGFIIFATTHLPDILDPALRRPGRFDETISLPYIPALYSRWTNYRYNIQNLTSALCKQYSIPFNSNFNKGSTLDFSQYSFSYNDSQFEALFPIYSSMSSFGRLSSWQSHRSNTIGIKGRITSHKKYLEAGLFASPLSLVAPLQKRVDQKTQSLDKDNTMSNLLVLFLNKNLPVFYNRSTAYASNTLISLMLYSSKERDIKNGATEVYGFSKNGVSDLNKQLPTSYNTKDNIVLTSQHQGLKIASSLKWPTMLKESKINNQFLENYSNYLSLFGPSYFNKMNFGQIIFISFIANKIGETFGLSSNYKKQYSLRPNKNIRTNKKFDSKFKDIRKGQSQSQSQSQVNNLNSFLFNFHQKSDWKNGPSLLSSYIQKRFPHFNERNSDRTYKDHKSSVDLSTRLFPYSVQQQKSKVNLITFYSSQLLNFNNKYSLMEPPSPPISNILLPAKRYEHYKRSFKNFYALENEKTSETIKKHQQQRLLKRLYNYPIKEFFRNEKISLFRNFNKNDGEKMIPISTTKNDSSKNFATIASSFSVSKAIRSKGKLSQQKQFIREMHTGTKSNFVNFTQSYFILGGIESLVPRKLASLNKFSSLNHSYRNILYSRHKTYLINQWWNGQQGEHNLESTFFSDIDWRYTQIKKNSSSKATLIISKDDQQNTNNISSSSQVYSNNDIQVDFPDCEQFYNPRNRRWILTKGDWNYWFNIDANLNKIYSHYINESFSKVYKSLDSNREFLDFYSAILLKSSFNLKKLAENSSKQNISFMDLNQRDILILYKRFFYFADFLNK